MNQKGKIVKNKDLTPNQTIHALSLELFFNSMT